MAYTYSKLASVTVGSGGSSSIDFIAIPQNYTDLVVKHSLRQSGYTGVTWDWLKFRFNGSSSTVYSSRDLEGNGANVYSNTFTSQNGMVKLGLANSTTSTSSTFSNGELYIPNYTSSSNKSVSGDGVHEDNATNAITVLGAGLWADTSAITSILLYPENGTAWVQYSTATLYGIKAEV